MYCSILYHLAFFCLLCLVLYLFGIYKMMVRKYFCYLDILLYWMCSFLIEIDRILMRQLMRHSDLWLVYYCCLVIFCIRMVRMVRWILHFSFLAFHLSNPIIKKPNIFITTKYITIFLIPIIPIIFSTFISYTTFVGNFSPAKMW